MRRTTMALLFTLVSLTARGDVTDSAAGGFGIEHARTVPLAPAEAWTAFVDEVGQWWNGDHTWFGDASALSIDAQAGGCFCERGADGSVTHLDVGMARPGHTLRLLGGLGPLQELGVAGAMSIDFEGEGEGRGTRLRLVYRVSGYTPGGLEAWAGPVDGVLAEQLDRFAVHARRIAERDGGRSER